MKTEILQNPVAAVCDRRSTTSESTTDVKNAAMGYGLDFWFFAIIIAALNAPMLLTGSSKMFAFFPSAVVTGEWWRVLTHPFAHVSAYHLLLDAAAFFILYSSLEQASWFKRVGCAAICATGSLVVPLLIDSRISEIGLCGLSGIAHGLMVVAALEMANRRGASDTQRWIGAACFIGVAGKSLLETWTGGALFQSLHPASLGIPIVASHLGGVLGGAVAYGFSKWSLQQAEVGE
jgi:rhomboid family GlyGly-CTERM serine protease